MVTYGSPISQFTNGPGGDPDLRRLKAGPNSSLPFPSRFVAHFLLPFLPSSLAFPPRGGCAGLTANLPRTPKLREPPAAPPAGPASSRLFLPPCAPGGSGGTGRGPRTFTGDGRPAVREEDVTVGEEALFCPGKRLERRAAPKSMPFQSDESRNETLRFLQLQPSGQPLVNFYRLRKAKNPGRYQNEAVLPSRESLFSVELIKGTRVQALFREDPTCRGATKPMHHSYRSPHALEPVLRNKRSHRNEKPAHHNEE
ncbi:hypothetical protein J1605_010753 [Eschrichtius robustus]|uniref:Uncharacterized protein n=1 Tax=Eschrichtius robustus TaxID=9764 RepID=A0AB34GQG1_ESCRO|nr:hypothetical protein J1605_010753 [Eschrichtius robustus]